MSEKKADKQFEIKYEQKIAAHRRKIAARILYLAAAAVLIAVLYCAIKYVIIYSSYKVISEDDRSAGTSVQYAQFYGKILRYSKDGATFYQNRKKTIWNETYEMQNPMLDVCGRYAVIAEQNGMQVYMFGLDGKKTSFEVTMPIKKAQVSEKGTLALLLEKDGEHYLQYYDSEGSLIAEGKSVFEKSGYPLDISLSDDGLKLAVSYLLIENGMTKSNVTFYSFASIGASEIDNIVAAETYENMVVPTVYYADDKTAFAFGDGRFTVFEGTQRPEVRADIEIEGEIQSIFYDESYAGLVFETENGKRMDVYNTEGKQVLSREFDFDYQTIKISGERIIMYNDKEWCIYGMNGRMKLSPCELSGVVSDIVALSSNQYLLVKANKTEIVKLKL